MMTTKVYNVFAPMTYALIITNNNAKSLNPVLSCLRTDRPSSFIFFYIKFLSNISPSLHFSLFWKH